jgi:flavorubredoxin
MADGLLIGSPTINQNTLLPVYKLFALINPIRDKGKLGGAFGSYGWSGESPNLILENLRLLKLKIFEETAAFKFSPENHKKEYLKNSEEILHRDISRNVVIQKIPVNCRDFF